MTITASTDVIIPSVFTPYMQRITEQKSRLVQSGVLVRDARLDALLAGPGLTFNMPAMNDLADDEANVSTAATGNAITPVKATAAQEIGVRLNRNQAWGAADLVAALAGKDPMQTVAARLAPYWTRRLQATVLALLVGVFADNTAHDSADYTNDVSGVGYVAGTTTFNAENFIDTIGLMGDSSDDLGIMFMHSVVYFRALKNNLIDFIPDATNPAARGIPTFLGREVIVDDGAANSAGVYQTLVLGGGALALGVGIPAVPIETERTPSDAGGGGSTAVYSRVEWMIHPVGASYIGTPGAGGPTNATSANNLGHADSWNRIAPERKMVKISRLITREHA